uniref:Uncharacterized protein n=1 Tax=Arundo donax TaxID=35708 RepID=A0A0A9PT62_ARUDO
MIFLSIVTSFCCLCNDPTHVFLCGYDELVCGNRPITQSRQKGTVLY